MLRVVIAAVLLAAAAPAAAQKAPEMWAKWLDPQKPCMSPIPLPWKMLDAQGVPKFKKVVGKTFSEGEDDDGRMLYTGSDGAVKYGLRFDEQQGLTGITLILEYNAVSDARKAYDACNASAMVEFDRSATEEIARDQSAFVSDCGSYTVVLRLMRTQKTMLVLDYQITLR